MDATACVPYIIELLLDDLGGEADVEMLQEAADLRLQDEWVAQERHV